MKLRARLDFFSAALLSALGVSQFTACGGSALVSGESGGATNVAGSGSGAASGAAGAGVSPGGAASAGAAAGGASGVNHHPCQNPRDNGDGTVTCDGFTHRAEVLRCVSKLPRPDSQAVPDQAPTQTQCTYDADCTERAHGFCLQVCPMGGACGAQRADTFCGYGCVEDGECTEGEICECGDPIGRCVPARCRADFDCSPGFFCRSYDSSRGCGATQYACQSPADQCGSEAECIPGPDTCWYDADVQRFSCVSSGCVIGRPFLVAGEQRFASAVQRADWRALDGAPCVVAMRAPLRAQLAAEWTQVALLEHASIAAFARFALQLLSLGAPPELVERTTAAMADETKHAQACFAVASAYAGQPVGPGPLAVDRSLDVVSLRDIVLLTIREGCIGETVAAIEAMEALEHTTDPTLRELLLTISEDETRHAELAFRFVQWALSAGDSELFAAVRDEFESLQSETAEPTPTLDVGACQLLQHGVIPNALRSVIRARAVREVILPCARSLYAPHAVSAVSATADR